MGNLAGVAVTVQDSSKYSTTTDVNGAFALSSPTTAISDRTSVSNVFAAQLIGRDLIVQSPLDGALQLSLVDGAGHSVWEAKVVSVQGTASATLPTSFRTGPVFLRIRHATGVEYRAVNMGSKGLQVSPSAAAARAMAANPTLIFKLAGYDSATYTMASSSAAGITVTMTAAKSDTVCQLPTSQKWRLSGNCTVMIGTMSTGNPSVEAPFDAQYQYVVSPPAPSSDVYTAKSCPDGTNWWGCVGGSIGGLVTNDEARAAQATYLGKSYPQRVMWTWFELGLLVPGTPGVATPWQDEVRSVNKVDLLTRYLNDYRFLLQKIGTTHDMIDLEPDFFGFARGYGPLDQDSAQVTAANPTDCGNQPNTVAGLARCLIAMTRKYAPNTAVGLHLTCWDWPGNVDKCAKDYMTLGGKDADFLVGEVESTDAGLNALHDGSNTFWSDAKWATQLAYWNQMADSVGHPIVVWQIPLGNMAQNNTAYHFQDDKVDWLFSHMDQVATAHVGALMFGQGSDSSTTAQTDGGNLYAKTAAYRNAGGTPLK
jgi:hypothetical protein